LKNKFFRFFLLILKLLKKNTRDLYVEIKLKTTHKPSKIQDASATLFSGAIRTIGFNLNVIILFLNRGLSEF